MLTASPCSPAQYPRPRAPTAANLGESIYAARHRPLAERRGHGHGAPGARLSGGCLRSQSHAHQRVPGAPLRAYPRLGHHAAGVYRAGDTVQYKVYVRDQDNQRFIPAPRTGYRLQIIDPTDKVAHEVQEVSLSAFGAYHGEFTVPQNGAVGWYRFVLSAAFAKEDAESAEETIAPVPGSPCGCSSVTLRQRLSASPLICMRLHWSEPADQVMVTTQAKLHAGGPTVRRRCA